MDEWVLCRLKQIQRLTAFLKTSRRTQIGLVVGCLIGYAVLMQLVPVPGFGPANLEPGTNLGAWLDRLIFGEAHLWKTSRTWDPEGLLGTLPALGTGLLGVLTAQWLRRPDREPAAKVENEPNRPIFGKALSKRSRRCMWNRASNPS